MKKNIFKKILAVVLMLTMLTVAFGAQAATSGASLKKGAKIITTGSENLRAEPNKDAKSKAIVPKDTKLTLTANSKRDDRGVAWYKVSYNGKTGWVSSKYAKQTKDTLNYWIVRSVGKIHLRKSPSLDGTIITTVASGTEMKSLEKCSTDERGVNWYKVQHNGKTGWVSSLNIEWDYR